MFREQLANVLSLSRLAITAPTAWAIVQQRWLLASLLLLFAMLSDVADGYVARRLNTSSALGGIIDHCCDAVFVTCCLMALVWLDALPLLLPLLVALAFMQYMLDSKVLAGQQLRSSVLGRNNGVAYFVLVALVVWSNWLFPDPLPAIIVAALAWMLIASTLISMAERLYTLLSLRAVI